MPLDYSKVLFLAHLVILLTYFVYSRNLQVYIKQIGHKKVRVDGDLRKEVSLMKNARHSKLTEFIGLILEPQRTFIVEGNLSFLM